MAEHKITGKIMAHLFKNRKERLNQGDLSDITRSLTNQERFELQQTLLHMYKDLLTVCDRYGIIPFLCGGSALGAVRHNGFIPWDDDLDIAMTRSDFKKLAGIFHSELSDQYVLNAPNYSKNAKARFPKVIKINTVFQEVGTIKEPPLNGVFLDIFLIDDVPDNHMLRMAKGLVCNIEEFISGCVYDYENLDETAKQYHKRGGLLSFCFRLTVGKFFSFIPSSNWFHAIDKTIRYSDNNSRECTLAQGRFHYFGEILPREVVFPPKYVDFCGIKTPVFHNVDYYLRNMYGNYMELPAEEKRENHHIIDLKL